MTTPSVIVFGVDDLDAAVAYLHDAGVTVCGEPTASSSHHEGQRWVYFLSPPGWTERARLAAMAERTGEPEREDRDLDSDDDALDAYNRWLAKMAERDR